MMTPLGPLPSAFEALERFVERWALTGRTERVRRRIESQPGEREEFYESAREFLVPALRYLDTRPLDELTEPDKRLLNLCLVLAHVALATEQQRDAEPSHARVQARFVIERTSEDFGRTGPTPSATC